MKRKKKKAIRRAHNAIPPEHSDHRAVEASADLPSGDLEQSSPEESTELNHTHYYVEPDFEGDFEDHVVDTLQAIVEVLDRRDELGSVNISVRERLRDEAIRSNLLPLRIGPRDMSGLAIRTKSREKIPPQILRSKK